MVPSLIVAMSTNRVIGRAGGLPWRLSADLKRFKELTMGHHIIMGRKTFESIGRPLNGRTMVVITRQPERIASHGTASHSLADALRVAEDDPESFVIGGAQIYRAALPLTQRLYLTKVHAVVEGDVTFPDFSHDDWSQIERTDHPADARNEFPYSFLVLDRVSQPQTASQFRGAAR